MTVRLATQDDYDSIWYIIQSVISGSDTYLFSPDSSREKMLQYWCPSDAYTFVAEENDVILGTYVLRDNRPDLGSHIGNCAYMVSPDARGMGVGKLLGQHSIDEARRCGYRAIQFNYVVKSNEAAVKLWLSLGFEIVGEVPGAFKHGSLGYTNIYVMYKNLEV
ncbi:MAG: GNAT family N-acetyltransferase [Saprospiraceae bacterium]